MEIEITNILKLTGRAFSIVEKLWDAWNFGTRIDGYSRNPKIYFFRSENSKLSVTECERLAHFIGIKNDDDEILKLEQVGSKVLVLVYEVYGNYYLLQDLVDAIKGKILVGFDDEEKVLKLAEKYKLVSDKQ